MWHLVLKNLFRNKRRTLLTGSGVAISLFLLTSLGMVYAALGKPFEGIDASPRLMVRRLSGIVFAMPWSYGVRIKAVPGVVAVTPMNWFGAYWKDRNNQFANFAIDPNAVFDVLDIARIPPDQLEAFKRERVAAVAGRRLIDQFRWKIGDRITLLGSPYGVAPEVILRGIWTGGPEDQLYFHYEYLNELLGGHFDQVGLWWIRVERPQMAPRVAEAIDATFRNSAAETKTETENTFLLSFISMLGNVRGMILIIGSAVTFAILLIVANTMAMSIRERIPEAAVMRALGFRGSHILTLLVGESLALTLTGALAGVGGAKLIYDALSLRQMGPLVFADFRVRAVTLVSCFALSLVVALVASGWPAYRAARVNIAQALRYVG